MLSFLAGSLIIKQQSTDAVSGLGLVGDPTLSMSTSTSSILTNMTPTNSGIMAAGAHNLTVSTNVPSGYGLTINTTSASSLPTTSGTLTSPATLANNSWGYAINRVSSSSADNTIVNGFDASYTVPTPAASSKWADPTVLTKIKNTNKSSTNDETTVYFGAKADITLQSGTYSNTVRYEATANIDTFVPPTIISVSPSYGTTNGGDALIIIGTGFTHNVPVSLRMS